MGVTFGVVCQSLFTCNNNIQYSYGKNSWLVHSKFSQTDEFKSGNSHSGLTLFAFCVLVWDLLGAMHNLAQPLLLSLSPSFLLFLPLLSALSSPVSTLSPPLPPFLLYALQVYFTTWFPQCPPISLGHRCPPLEASAPCSVSPPPLPLPKPTNTPLPNQPPRAWPLCPHLSPPPCHRPNTAAPSRSCIAPLLPRCPCPLHHPCTVSPPLQHPHTLMPCHPPDQTPSTPHVCPTPLYTITGHSHPLLTPSPPRLPPLLLSLLPPLRPTPLPLCQTPRRLVHSLCTTPLVCPLHHQQRAAQVVVGACGGLRACMVPTPPPSSPAPDLDRFLGVRERGGRVKRGKAEGNQRVKRGREWERLVKSFSNELLFWSNKVRQFLGFRWKA